jgi:MoaA/NifB/PqqE/SkfB family radical SAM enzyme
MPAALFDKLLALLPLAADEDSWLVSCMYEPTIHPEFGRFLLAIPPEHRRKATFTTNLAGCLTDDMLAAIAAVDLHHFNLSLDSWDPELYRRLRVGATLEAFTGNLLRLLALRPRRLQFITLVFRSNAAEIPSLVRACAEQYGATMHEVRLPQEGTCPDRDVLSLNEWEALVDRLRQMPYKMLARNEWYRPFTCERIN